VARSIWQRYSGSDLSPELTLARTVALGIIARESLSPALLGHIASDQDFMVNRMAAEK
jgi:hypothetical protein